MDDRPPFVYNSGGKSLKQDLIIDSHIHVWEQWPYKPVEASLAFTGEGTTGDVPDPGHRAQADLALFEMDLNEVNMAVIVCLALDGNPSNNDYVAGQVAKSPDRFIQFADIDGFATSTYHRPQAAERLESAVKRYNLKGFNHYLKGTDDGSWFLSEEGIRFFKKASELRQIVSLSCPNPISVQPVLQKVARLFPDIPFLIHHLGHVSATETYPYRAFRSVLDSAALPNIRIKLSGPHYISEHPWDYPYSDSEWVVRGYYEFFGPDRLIWGSDYPVVRDATNYRQSLQWIREHLPFLTDEDKAKVLGGNIAHLLSLDDL